MSDEIFEVTEGIYNPPHPGEVLQGLYLEPLGLTITKAAQGLGVDRKTVSRIVNGHSPITIDMAMRLAKALDTSEGVWLGMQQTYDLWHAKHDDNKVDLSAVKVLYEKEKLTDKTL